MATSGNDGDMHDYRPRKRQSQEKIATACLRFSVTHKQGSDIDSKETKVFPGPVLTNISYRKTLPGSKRTCTLSKICTRLLTSRHADFQMPRRIVDPKPVAQTIDDFVDC